MLVKVVVDDETDEKKEGKMNDRDSEQPPMTNQYKLVHRQSGPTMLVKCYVANNLKN